MNLRKLLTAVLLIVASTCYALDEADDKDFVGIWKDNKYDDALNARYEIYLVEGVYYLRRLNSDGSEGSYPLKKMGNKYIKVGDKFGAYYLVSEEGLKIYDRQGHIRTAKPIPE